MTDENPQNPADNQNDATPRPVPPVEFSNPDRPLVPPRYAGEAPEATSAYPAPRYEDRAPSAAPQAPVYHQPPAPSDNSYFGSYPQAPAAGAGYGYVAPEKREAKKSRSKLVSGVVALVLVSGLAGGGIGGGIVAANSHNGVPSVSSSASQVISTSNEKTVSDLSDVVSTASKSVVTVSSVASSEQGTGSGVVLNAKEGYIVTNAHVATLEGLTASAKLTVQTSTGDVYAAKLVGYDATADLAVLKVSGTMKGVSDIKFASSTDLAVGTGTIAIGAPLGLSGTVTTGIVSALNRPITVASSEVSSDAGSSSSSNPFAQGGESTQTSQGIALNVIQTDAAINPGNSGGALLDDNGNLIGINVAIASASNSSSATSQSGSVGVGFAIPSDYVKRIATEIISNGEGTHGFLGVGLSDYSASNSAFTSGAKLTKVTANGAAAKSGLQTGDVITKLDGKAVSSALQLAAIVRQDAPGTQVTIEYLRDGKAKTTTVDLSSDN